MALILRRESSSNRTPCPEGLYDAVCVDVIDLGEVPTTYGDKHQIQMLWEVRTDEGIVYHLSKRYTATLHEKAKLAQDLKAWRGGVDLSAEEMRGFDLEQLVGKCCQLLVTHFEREGAFYASVDKILKPKKKVTATGSYDAEATKSRLLERISMQQAGATSERVKAAFAAPSGAARAATAAAGIKAQDKGFVPQQEPDDLPF